VLFLRNLFEAGRISPGFDTLQTIRADVHLPSARYDDPQRSRAFVASALQAMDAAPGIRASAAAYLVPLTDGSNYRRPIIFADSGERVEVAVHWNAVSPRYFQVMAIPFVSGSTFAPREDSAATPVIVNREWTRRYSPQRPVVGRSFRHDGNATTLYRVVGVVEGTKNRTLGEEPLPQLYEHLALKGVERSRVQLIAQVTGPPALAVPAVVAALRGVEPAAGVTVEPMAASMAFAMLPSQVGATMLGSLGLLGLGLAAVGLYGVIAYSVTRRRREIGIRMAVGAGRSNIVRLVLGEAVWLVGLGAVIGLGAALLLTRPLAAFLVPGVSPADPVSYAAVLLALTLTAVLASAAPVLRAIHVAPTQALKAE
jgi:hypothetical protein